MPKPWEKYGGASAGPAPVVVGTAKPEKPDAPPSGYRWGPGGTLVPIAGGPATNNDPPSGYRWGAGGGLEPIPGGPADKPPADPKLVEAERTAAFLATRIAGGMGDIDRAVAASPSSVKPELDASILGIFGNGARNWANSPARRQVEAAQLDIIDAALTLGTGAAYTPEQLEGYRQSYFPTLTDDPATIQAKQGRLQRLLEAAKLKAGGAAPQIDEALRLLSGRQPGARPGQESEDRDGPPGLAVDVTDDRLPGETEAEYQARAAQGQEAGGAPALSPHDQAVQDEVRQMREMGTAPSDSLMLTRQGMTFGLSDEAAGIGRAISRAVQLRDPIEGYRLGRDAERLQIDQARDRMGWAGTALEVGGGFLSGNPTNALMRAPTLFGRVKQGAKAGALIGGTAGFGYGEGTNSLLTAGGGALGGAAVAGVLPVAGQVIRNRVGGLNRLLGRDPALPRRMVGEALEADANTPRAAGAMMDDAHSRGSPMMLADTGDNARGLLSSVGRQPGASRRVAREAVIERQNAQAERIADAVRRDLGPTANIREMGEELVDRAKTAARPLYEEAYAAPGASAVKLDDLTSRPAFQRALTNARNLAAEEGADPTALGFQLSETGEVVLDRVPSWQTLDYVKRGLDDVVETYRDSTTRQLNLDGAGRATNATLRTLVARMDKINPTYAAARGAYAGPVRLRDAMDTGFKALTKSPDDLSAQIKNMSEMEREAYRMGLRKAITNLLESRKDGGDKVAFLVGTPAKRAALQRAFGGKSGFDKFIATLRDEEAMGLTYRSTVTGSPTAERMAADATTNDTGLAETAMDAALRGGKDSMWSAAVSAVQKLRDVSRFGAGEAGERTRESIAALLTETDPAVLREILVAARRAAAQQRVGNRVKSRRAVQAGRGVGEIIGMPVGRSTETKR